MAKKYGNPFLIGLFAITGAVILIGVIIWLGANQFLKEQTYYVTYFDSSVEGLEPGSAVKYLGVPCGRVSKIRVAPDGKLVEVIMQIEPNLHIYDSLRVKAEMAGIAGGKFLQLFVPSDPTISNMFPKTDFETPYPIIKAAPSGIEEITLAMRDVMNNLNRLNVQKISDGTIGFLGSTANFFNDPDLARIINELAGASARLNNVLGKADTSQIITQLSQTSFTLANTAKELESFSKSLNEQVTQMNLPEYMAKAYSSYDSTMANTNKSIGIITYRMENVLFGLNETFEEIRYTNKALQKSLRAFTDNPSQVLFTEPPPPEKK